MTSTIRAVIFDFNGVIIDDEPLHVALLERVVREAGLPVTTAACHAAGLGVPDRAGLQTLFQQAQRPLSETMLQDLLAKKAQLYQAAIAERDLLFPDVASFVRQLAQRLPLALVSGALRAEITAVLARADLLACFAPLISSEDVAQGKPHPEGFLQALAALNAQAFTPAKPPLRAAECLVIEDSLAGVAAAKRAGMPCLAVTSSYATSELCAQPEPPDFIVNRLHADELRAALPQLYTSLRFDDHKR